MQRKRMSRAITVRLHDDRAINLYKHLMDSYAIKYTHDKESRLYEIIDWLKAHIGYDVYFHDPVINTMVKNLNNSRTEDSFNKRCYALALHVESRILR